MVQDKALNRVYKTDEPFIGEALNAHERVRWCEVYNENIMRIQNMRSWEAVVRPLTARIRDKKTVQTCK